MVNRVDNSNIYTNSYTTGSVQRKKVDAASVPAFLLDHDEQGVVWDRGQEERPKDKISGGKTDTYESTIVKSEEKEKTEPTGAASDTDALFENISKVVKNLFKKILDFVWYGNDEKNGEGTEGTEVSADTKDEKPADDITSDTEKTLGEIKRTEKKRESRETAFVMPELEGTPAHNTSIITYYDRRGRIVKPDDIDTRRILFNETLGREIDAGEHGKYRKYM
ncbi:MAG: hypothetical protein K6A72_00535 [Lachnospiraceae bacterium]|nr:hypothetical protein [Lachnospiraceae bacterium]